MQTSKVLIENSYDITVDFNQWATQIKTDAYNQSKDFLCQRATDKNQEKLFLLALESFKKNYLHETNLPPLADLFSLIYRATNKQPVSYEKELAIINLLLSVGIGLLDDIADNELSENWHGIPLEAIKLTAYNLTGTLPQLAILDLPITQARRLLLLRIIMEFFLKISAGQQYEFRNTTLPISELSLKDGLYSISGKTGKWFGLYAAIAVCLAQGVLNTENPYLKFAFNIGMQAQLLNDLRDICFVNDSKDLSNGIKNFPLIIYANALNQAEKCQFEVLLNRAKTDISVRHEIKEKLLSNGTIRFCFMLLAGYHAANLNILKTKCLDPLVQYGLNKLVSLYGINST